MISLAAISQKRDTILIDASTLLMKSMHIGTNNYLVFYKMGKDSSRTNFEFWSREVKDTVYAGQPVFVITQLWENSNTVFHTARTIASKKDFSTLLHEVWSKRSGTRVFDYVNDTALQWARQQYFLCWHTDLETFSLLPYKEGVVFKINFYDPGFGTPSFQYYTVIGSGQLTGYNNQVTDCWLLKYGRLPENQEIFWISKKTKEVLKLEQEYSGKYRFKIKLGFSN